MHKPLDNTVMPSNVQQSADGRTHKHESNGATAQRMSKVTSLAVVFMKHLAAATKWKSPLAMDSGADANISGGSASALEARA